MKSKKEKEEERLKEAFAFARKKRGKTHRIMQDLEGEIIERVDAERPDFILRIKSKSKNDKGVILGIEHFTVDHYAFRNKKGEMESASKKDANSIKFIRNKYGNLQNASEQQVDNAFSETVNVLCQSVESKMQSGFISFIDSFKYALYLHLEKVEEYRKNLKKYIKEEKGKLCFYIEVLSDFSDLFLVTKEKVAQCKPGYLPLFDEIISLLQPLDERGVQYIIIAMRTPLTENLIDVIALSTKNIRLGCAKQRVTIYRYAAKDRLINSGYYGLKDVNVSCEIKKEEGQYDACYRIETQELKPEYMYKFVDNAVCCACWAKAHDESYVADRVVLMTMDIMGPYIVKWEQGEEPWMFVPIYRKIPSVNDLCIKVAETMRKYGFPKGDIDETIRKINCKTLPERGGV